jgi:hypothetical protein
VSKSIGDTFRAHVRTIALEVWRETKTRDITFTIKTDAGDISATVKRQYANDIIDIIAGSGDYASPEDKGEGR